MVFKNRLKQTNSCSLTFRWRNKEWADDGVFIAQLALQVVIGGPRSDKTAIHQGLPSPQTAVIARQWILFSRFLFFLFLPPLRCGIIHEEQEALLTSKSPLTNWPPSQKWVWLCRIQQKSRALINHWARHLSPERVEGGGGWGWP